MRRLNDDDYDYTICMLKSEAKDYHADEELMQEAIDSIQQLRADLKQAVNTIHDFACKELELRDYNERLENSELT